MYYILKYKVKKSQLVSRSRSPLLQFNIVSSKNLSKEGIYWKSDSNQIKGHFNKAYSHKHRNCKVVNLLYLRSKGAIRLQYETC